MALVKYEFNYGEGLYTYLHEICPDQDLDNLHSIYLDQLDWERIISIEERSQEFLEQIVNQIYSVIKKCEDHIHQHFPFITPILPDRIRFLHYSSVEPIDSICKEYGTVFLMKEKPGECYHSSVPAQNNLPDLNGDLWVWYPLLNRPFKLLSIGINEDSKISSWETAQKADPKNKPDTVVDIACPPSIGGEIEQSRLWMFILRKAHIGEVQSSVWPEDIIKKCNDHNVFLL